MSLFSPDPNHQAWFELPDGRTFWLRERNMIGRQAGNDLVLDDLTLSRQHALVTAGPTGFMISDMQSRNGTYVSGQSVKRAVQLRDGDEVVLGSVTMRFRCKRRLVLPDPALGGSLSTQLVDQVRSRMCWLAVIDVEGYTAAVTELGSEVALRRLQSWIAGARPHIEQNHGRINSYVGDAIFAYWPCDSAQPDDVLAALHALENWRPSSPLPFRLVVHHGSVLFTRSEHGEELGGADVTLIFRMEKIAKGFGSDAMLSSAAAASLNLEGRCEIYGRSAVDGMSAFTTFYALPRDLAGT